MECPRCGVVFFRPYVKGASKICETCAPILRAEERARHEQGRAALRRARELDELARQRRRNERAARRAKLQELAQISTDFRLVRDLARAAPQILSDSERRARARRARDAGPIPPLPSKLRHLTPEGPL